MRSRARLVSLLLLGLGVIVSVLPGLTAADKSDPALERTRKQVRMLDDLYKTAVVLITEHYVNKDGDLPAGTAAKALFGAMKSKGWHEVRLVDATGDPIMKANSPADDFEKAAVKQLLAGKAGHEEVVEKEGQRYLRSATPIPVVMKKCIMCHPHYEDVKQGQPIGALAYTLPIE
ncbi:MAG: c-type heme family protein [Planctomycetaceae bacterium]